MLGAVLLSDRVHYAFVIEEGLRPADFYRERHRVIYESMLDLYTESEPIDVLTVTEHLRSRGKLEEAGGAAEIDALTGAVPAVGQPAPLRLDRPRALAPAPRCSTRRTRSRPASTATTRRPARSSSAPRRLMLEVGHDDRAEGLPPRSARSSTRRSTSGSSSPSRARSLTGTPSGFTDLDDDHRRLPAGQPDRHRGAPVDGEVGPGHQHRRERRAAPRAAAAGRPVLARDVGGRARPALHRLAGVDQGRRPAQGPAEGRGASGSAC